MSKSRDRLQSYLDELLSDVNNDDKVLDSSEVSKSNTGIRSDRLKTQQIVQPNLSFTAGAKTIQSQGSMNVNLKATHDFSKGNDSLSRSSVEPKKQPNALLQNRQQLTSEEDQFTLAEEKKRQLQQLLMPKAMVTKPKVHVIKKEVLSVKVTTPDLTSITDGLNTKSSVKDSCIEDTSVVDSLKTQETDLESINRLDEFLEWGDNGRPMWAQNKFDALLFQVSGLTLAVPLIALGQIVTISDKLTPIFGQSEWFMGILPTPIGKLRTINTALFVMPERYDPSFVKSAKYVISLDGQRWGLAVDSVTQPISVDPNEVKWRGERTSRPWLAGTVKSSMCALIDIPQMAKLLNSSDKSTYS